MLHIETIHPMDEYIQLLRSAGGVYVNNTRLEQALYESRWSAEDMRDLALMWLKIESGGVYTGLSKDNIIDYLYRIGIDLDKRYRSKKVKGNSLDMTRVVNPLIEAGVATELLTSYKQYRSFMTYSSFLKSMMQERKPCGKTLDGSLILHYNTNIEARDNLRAYYSKLAVVSIPKMYSNIIMGKTDGHYIAWCDYPQADWRFAYNLFIKDSTNEAIMRGCDDAYEGLAQIVEGDSFSHEGFAERRKQYKVNCLKVFYNSKDQSEIPSLMRKYYMSRQKYRDLYNDLYLLQKFRLPVPCKSYFGFEQLLPEQQIPSEFVAKGLSTPNQTFTSEVVIETVFGVLERFWSMGYTPEDINVYFVRHDEPLFMFTKKVIKDAWIFEDCSSIHIDGFTPIHLDFHYGSYYKEEDPNLTAEIKRVCAANTDKLHYYEGGQMKEYHPFPSVGHVAVTIKTANGQTKLQMYDYKQQKRYEFNVHAVIDSAEALTSVLLECLEQYMGEPLGYPQYLLVKCLNVTTVARIWENTLVKVDSEQDLTVF